MRMNQDDIAVAGAAQQARMLAAGDITALRWLSCT
jgi:hypothetical protein